MNTTGIRGLVLLALASAGAGCAREVAPGDAPKPKPQAFTRVQLVRTGGFAGVHDTMTIDGMGRWEFTPRASGRGTQGSLGSAAMDKLIAAVAAVDWAGLKDHYAGNPRVADCFSYEVLFTGPEGRVTRTRVGNFEVNTGAPAELKKLISLVESLTARR